jgi:uncharacterized membrane protein
VRGQLIKRYFITGLLIWVPLVITGWVLSLDRQHPRPVAAPAADLHPPTNAARLCRARRGAVLTLVLILLTGLPPPTSSARSWSWWEKLLARIPVVKSIYYSVKQVSDTLFRPTATPSARPAGPVPTRRQLDHRLPDRRPGDIANHLQGEHVSVYVPTTPNPTSGFFLMMRPRMYRTRHERR